MTDDAGQRGRWLVRALAAAAMVAATTAAIATLLERPDPMKSPPVQVAAVASLDGRLVEASSRARAKFTVAFFGDSFALSENLLTRVRAAPTQLRRQLGSMMRNAGAGEPDDLRLVELTFSGLSLWSLYYLTDAIVDLQPDYVVVECNLFGFSDYWRKRDRRIVSAMLPIRRVPEILGLPVSDTGLTMDEWLFARAVYRLGAMSWWEAAQHEQVRVSEWRQSLESSAQQLVGESGLRFRDQLALQRIAATREPSQNRATRSFARLLLGPALNGLDADAPAFRMLVASLERLRNAGIGVLVYVPPYNLQHLRELGLLEGSRLEDSIALVRSVVEQSGARFHDAHALLGDAYFRDSMDHLHEAGDADGQRAVAIDLARAMAGDWRAVLTKAR